MPPKRTSPYRLLVEGVDDLHSVIHLLKRHDYDWDSTQILRPYVHETGSLNDLLAELPVTLKGPYDRIGILVDANGNSQNRWAQIRDRAKQAGLGLFRHDTEEALRFVAWFNRLFVDV